MGLDKRTSVLLLLVLLFGLASLLWVELSLIASQDRQRASLKIRSKAAIFFNTIDTVEEQVQFMRDFLFSQWEKVEPRSVKYDNFSIEIEPIVRERKNFSPYDIRLDSLNHEGQIEVTIKEILKDNTHRLSPFLLVTLRKSFTLKSLYFRSEQEGYYVLLFNGTGKVLYQSSSRFSSPSVCSVLFKSLTSKRWTSSENVVRLPLAQANIWYRTYPLFIEDNIRGYLVFVIPQSGAGYILKSFTTISLVIILLVGIIFYFFYRSGVQRMTASLRQIASFTQSVAQGNFSQRLNMATSEEVKAVSEYLNSMVMKLAQLKEYEKKLVMVNRMSGLAQLSRGIAHEIKNPLMVIKYATAHLKKKVEPSVDQEDIELIDKNIERIEHIVHRLADFSKPSDLDPVVPISLLKSVEVIIRNYQKTLRNSNITVEIVKPVFQPVVSVKRNSIEQILNNIILNAIEAMPQGGHLMIGFQSVVKEQGELWVECIIEDTGGGIDEQEMESIFNPFFTTKDQGTGLGLSIAHQLTTEMGGTITVEPITMEQNREKPHAGDGSAIVRGTRVRLSFPMTTERSLKDE